MDNWQKFNGNTKPPKEAFYSKLNFEGISYADYEHGKKVWEVFKIKNLGEYHDLYVHTLLLAGVCENFRDKCIELYELDLDPAHFLSAPGLA